MALTKKDLQSIGELMDQKLESKLEEKLESKLEEKLESKLDEKLEPIKKDLKIIKRKLNTTIRTFDRDFNYHHRRLDQLEEKVGVKPPEFVQKVN